MKTSMKLLLKYKIVSHKLQCLALLLIFFSLGCEKEFIESPVTIGKSIALTFDDGPDPIYTEKILDVLKEKGVKATFFLVGDKIKQNSSVVERMFAEGHCLANHTYTHIDLKKKSFKDAYSEIQRTEQLIVDVCGKSPKLFRPPWGHITSSEREALNRYGYEIVLWDLNSKDYVPKITVDEIVANVMKNIGGNKIVLFHDSDYLGKAGRQNTVLALPQIIDLLKQMGYRFVTIDQMDNVGK